MKLTARVTVLTMLKLDVIGAIGSFVIATLFPVTQNSVLVMTGMCLAHIPIYTPVGLLRGFNFIMYDAPPDAPIKNYHFLAIFLSAAASPLLLQSLIVLSDSVRNLLIW